MTSNNPQYVFETAIFVLLFLNVLVGMFHIYDFIGVRNVHRAQIKSYGDSILKLFEQLKVAEQESAKYFAMSKELSAKVLQYEMSRQGSTANVTPINGNKNEPH
jgi:hypothetical protein